MMVGLLEPTSGSIKIDGYDIRTQPLEVKKSIAWIWLYPLPIEGCLAQVMKSLLTRVA